jgi:DNA-binding IclR family transcriptional regulator
MAMRRGIQSIEIGGKILLALQRSQKPMVLKDIARETQMPAAKIHPYLVSFIKLELVEQDAATGLYDLGRQSLQLGLSYLQKLDVARFASAEMRQLSVDTGQSVALAVWGNLGPTILRFEQSSYPVLVYLRVGTVMSLVNTATGLAFSAFMPPNVVRGLMKLEPYRFGGSEASANMSWDKVEAALSDVRRRGLARAVSLTVPGLNAFSVPIFDHTRQIALTITITGPNSNFDKKWTGVLAKKVTRSAEQISRSIGFGG